MSTLTTAASTAALLAAGLNTRLARALHTSGVPLVPQGPPGPDETGFVVSGSKAVDVRVSLHRDARARSIFLLIDRDNAPLTGNYVLEIDTTSATYDATSSAPANVDALLAGWAAQIESTHTGWTATPGPFSGMAEDDHDGILVTAPTDTGEYATGALGASTSAPAGAALAIYREPDSVSLRVWLKSGMTLPADYTLAWQGIQAQGWALANDVGEIPHGYDDRLDLAARTAVWPELYDFVSDDEAISVVESGAGVYALVDVAVVAVAPTVAP